MIQVPVAPPEHDERRDRGGHQEQRDQEAPDGSPFLNRDSASADVQRRNHEQEDGGGEGDHHIGERRPEEPGP